MFSFLSLQLANTGWAGLFTWHCLFWPCVTLRRWSLFGLFVLFRKITQGFILWAFIRRSCQTTATEVWILKCHLQNSIMFWSCHDSCYSTSSLCGPSAWCCSFLLCVFLHWFFLFGNQIHQGHILITGAAVFRRLCQLPLHCCQWFSIWAVTGRLCVFNYNKQNI